MYGRVVTTRARAPHAPTNHTHQVNKKRLDITSVSTRFRDTWFRRYVTRHTHTTHQRHTTQGRCKQFEWTAILRPLDFFPPRCVITSAQTFPHTHTHAIAPWLTCAMESVVCNDAIATVPSPRSPHRLHPTTVGGGSLGTSARLPCPLSSRPSAQHRKAGQNR